MKILVTGSAGYIGGIVSTTCELRSRTGHRIREATASGTGGAA